MFAPKSRRLSSRFAAAVVVGVSSFGLLACAGSSDSSDEFGTQSDAISEAGQRLNEMRPYWASIAPTCEGHPAKEHCDDGDMALFNGLLCASGERQSCEAVRLSQGADGRFWRSPRRVDGNLGSPKSFSRDMTMGVLLYLASTKDTEAAQRWIQWIDHNRPCAIEKPFGGGCLVRGPHRVCRDDEKMTCTITPGLWAIMGRVWEHLGLPKHDEMKRWESMDGDIATLETTFTETGYPLHLKGVAVYLKEKMGVSASWRAENARILVNTQPANPFFRYLAEGPTPAVEQRLVDVCPRPETHATSRRFQWSWERADASEAWKESMGWECIFMHNLVRGPR